MFFAGFAVVCAVMAIVNLWIWRVIVKRAGSGVVALGFRLHGAPAILQALAAIMLAMSSPSSWSTYAALGLAAIAAVPELFSLAMMVASFVRAAPPDVPCGVMICVKCRQILSKQGLKKQKCATCGSTAFEMSRAQLQWVGSILRPSTWFRRWEIIPSARNKSFLQSIN